MLNDRNTIAMVAEHWGCSDDHVRRLINRGALACLRLGGIVRLTREQVEEYEKRCNSGVSAVAECMSAEGQK